MKNTMKKLLMAVATLAAVSESQAALLVLTNGDFEATTANAFPQGFDIPGNDVPGWQNLGAIVDSGVENSSAWWGTYSGYSAFLGKGDGAKLMTSHTIQLGDKFTFGLVSKTWSASSQFVVTFFYDDPANVIGTYSSGVTGTWTAYSNPTPIDATLASVGGTLGFSIQNTQTQVGSEEAWQRAVNFDNVTIDVVPEPSAALLGGLGMLALLRRRR
jgi:hypothetical protein